MTIIQDLDHQTVLSRYGSAIKEVNDFKYFGSFVANSKKNFNSCMVQA